MGVNKTSKVLVFSFSQVINLIINFFVSPYLSRALPKSEYSAFNQVIIIIGLSGVIFSFGLQAIVFLVLSKRENHQEKIVSTLQGMLLLLASFSAICLFLFSFFANSLFENSAIPTALRVCSLATFVTFINNYLLSLLVFNNETKFVAFFSVITSVFSVSFIYIALNFWHSIKTALFFSQVLAPMVSIILASFIVRKYLLLRIRIHWQSVKKLFAVSLPLYFTSLLGSSYVYVTSFFVIFLIGDIDYANYRNGAVEIPFISTVAFSVSSVLLPDLNRYFHEGNKNAALELKKKIINQCIFLLYPVIIFFIVYNFEFIVSYFSLKYTESALIFAIYSFTCFVRINDYQDVLITAGKSPYILKANVFYFIINLVLVSVLGLLFGIKGVAVAASLSVFSLAYMLLKKDAEVFHIRISAFFEVKNILVLVFNSFIFSVLIKMLLNHILSNNHLLVFIIAAAVYFPIIYLYILRKGLLVDSLVNIVVAKVPVIKYLLPRK